MSFLKSTAFYTAGNLLSRSAGFLLLPFYSKVIPASDYGLYALLMSFYTVMAGIIQGGLQQGFTKYYMDESSEEKRRTVFSTYFNFSFLMALAVCLLAMSLQDPLSSFIGLPEKATGLIRLVILMNFVDSLLFVVMYLLRTLEESKTVFLFTVVSAIVNIVLNLYFVFYRLLGIDGIIYSQLLTSIVLFSLLLIKTRRHILLFRINRELLEQIIKFSLPVALAGVLTNLTDVSDRFILDRYFDKTAVGIYSFSYRIAMVMNVFVISFRSSWTPYSLRVFREDRAGHAEKFGRRFNNLLLFSITLLLLVVIFIDDAAGIRFGNFTLFAPEYEAGFSIIPIVILGYLFSALGVFYSVYPYVYNKSYHFLLSDVTAFGCNILLNFLLIPLWGIKGAAVATCIGYIASALYLFIISRQISIKYDHKMTFGISAAAVLVLVFSRVLQNVITDIVLFSAFLLFVRFLFLNRQEK